MKVAAILMCGGIGSRLWPVSRRSNPKQFAKLFEEDSLLKTTLKRIQKMSFDRIVLVCSEDHITKNQFSM